MKEATPAERPVILVTGASSGIGAAIARTFAREGARLVLCARRHDRLQALAKELPTNVHVFALDVRDRAAVERAIGSLPADFAQISVLVNNAGLARGLAPSPQADLDHWDEMIDAKCKGLMYVTRAVLPGMVARDKGHIINIGSVAGTYPYPGGNVYGASKAFVTQFSLGLRADLTGKKIRVTDIEPGMVKDSEFSLVRFSGDADKAAAVYRDFVALTPDDIAETVRWCASLPWHVNVNRLELMSVMQSFAGFSVHRG